MDILFLSLKKLLVGTVFIVFAFVMIYVPQAPANQVETVEAAASGSVVFDPKNTLQNSWTTAQATISAAVDRLGWGKAISLDGIAWSLAKRAITMMATEFLNWVNSGFQGRPAFVTDLRGYLVSVADQELGEFISELGEAGSFICEPFRLDVQLAVATQLQAVADRDAAPASCTLTGVIENLQGFIDGTFEGRGLADWLTITSAPAVYTPQGAIFSAQAAGLARIINAQGEEIELLRFGGGFLSQSVCEIIEGTDEENCTITTPGTTIAGQVNKVLGLNQDILVQADEINEYIGELVTALANQAIVGGAGLLGLSGNNVPGYSGFDGSYLDLVNNEANEQAGGSLGQASDTLAEALRSERNYRTDSQNLLDQLAVFIVDTDNPAGQRNIATILNEEIANEIFRSNTIVEALTAFNAEFSTANSDRQVEIFIEYSNLDVTNEVRKGQNLTEWREQMMGLGIDVVQNNLLGFATGITNENLLERMESDLEAEESFLADLVSYRAALGSVGRNTLENMVEEIDTQIELTTESIAELQSLIDRYETANIVEIDEIRTTYQEIVLLDGDNKSTLFNNWNQEARLAGITINSN